MSEVFASAKDGNDGVSKKLVFIFKKVILLLNYNLLNNFFIDFFIDFLTIFHNKLIV